MTQSGVFTSISSGPRWKFAHDEVVRVVQPNVKSIVHNASQICSSRKVKLRTWASRARHTVSALEVSPLSIVILVAYVTLFCVQYVLMRASQRTKGEYPYNTALVVMLTEMLKLILATGFLLTEYPPAEMLTLFCKYRHVPLLYILPSSLYCISNNLTFLNLLSFDPTTYNVLSQLRIVLTGIVFQILFKKILSGVQWFALVLLTFGCIVKQLGAGGKEVGAFENLLQLAGWPGALLLAQMVSACLAGVLNELFLKKEDTGPPMFNNICMYATSLAANLTAVAAKGSLSDIVDKAQLAEIFCSPLVLAIVVNGAVSGMMIPLFLCRFNSISRVFTVSGELILLAVICWLAFGTPIDLLTVLTIVIVSVATYIYAKYPVQNAPQEAEKPVNNSESTCQLDGQMRPADSGVSLNCEASPAAAVELTTKAHSETHIVIVTKL